MGYVSFSMPREIVLAFKEKGGIENFIETGTFRGGTSFWAAAHFKKVYTIEIDPEISKTTASQPNCPENIDFFVGNSKDVLPELISKIKGRSVFWLDGHWCNVSEFGKEDECPLMDELKAAAVLQDALILIDDARAFLGPIPPPHNSSLWPRIDDIILLSKQLFPLHKITICDDVIYCIPPDLQPVFDNDWVSKYQQRFGVKPSFLQKLKSKLGLNK